MTVRRWSRLAAVVRRHGVLIVFILLVASMFVTTSTFGTYQNLRNVLQQNSIIGIIACGMTFAIILGGFDLSVGSMTALASVVGATLMIDLGTPGIPIGVIGAIAACLLVGATNGWLIAYLGVNPFVATLGTMTVVRGLIYVATNASPRFGVPYSFTTLGLGRLFGIPNPAILFLSRRGLARICSPSNALWPLRLRRRRQFRRLRPDGRQRRARALCGLRSRVPLRGDIGRHPRRSRQQPRHHRRRSDTSSPPSPPLLSEAPRLEEAAAA